VASFLLVAGVENVMMRASSVCWVCAYHAIDTAAACADTLLLLLLLLLAYIFIVQATSCPRS
jgi:hypothetical protein